MKDHGNKYERFQVGKGYEAKKKENGKEKKGKNGLRKDRSKTQDFKEGRTYYFELEQK